MQPVIRLLFAVVLIANISSLDAYPRKEFSKHNDEHELSFKDYNWDEWNDGDEYHNEYEEGSNEIEENIEEKKGHPRRSEYEPDYAKSPMKLRMYFFDNLDDYPEKKPQIKVLFVGHDEPPKRYFIKFRDYRRRG